MEHGHDFLKAQVANSVMQHRTLVENLSDHAKQAEDARYRQLCERYLPKTQQHQQMLEEFAGTLGAESAAKDAVGFVLGKARDAVDAVRNDDFLRIVGDIVTIRHAQDNFANWAATGERIGQPRMAEIGRHCERDHDQMQRDFNGLVQEMFVENAKDF